MSEVFIVLADTDRRTDRGRVLAVFATPPQAEAYVRAVATRAVGVPFALLTLPRIEVHQVQEGDA